MNRNHLTPTYLARVAALQTVFPHAGVFLRRLQEEGHRSGLWLSTSVNAHLYKGDAFLAYIKVDDRESKPPSLVLSPKFNHQIVAETTDQAHRVFPSLFDEILRQHGGPSASWAVRRLHGATELGTRTPAAFFESLADALLHRA